MASSHYKEPAAPVDERVSDLVGHMTIEEKVEQLGGWFFPHGKPPGVVESGEANLDHDIKTRLQAGVGAICVPNMALPVDEGILWVNALQRFLVEQTRLGIPALVCEECAWGHVALEATAFPAPPTLAASWNQEITRAVFAAAAREAASRGGSLAHTPIGDLARDPRWGRVRETFGEDTALAAAMVAAAVEGLQGGTGGARPGYMAATIKHFAAFGESRGGRQMGGANIGKHSLLNEILPPYRAAVDAGVEAVMPSYNAIDGVPSHGNRWLLTHILRDTWGFAGVTTADYGAIEKMVAMGVAADELEAARLALRSGLDMDLPHGDKYRALFATDRSSELLQLLDNAVSRVLGLKFRMGLFDAPYKDVKTARTIVACGEHRDLAVAAAIQGSVLLKNDGDILPLDPNATQRISLIGPHAALEHLGDDRTGRVTIIEGVRAHAGARIDLLYEPGCRLTTKDDVLSTYLSETANASLTELQNMDRDPTVAALYADELPRTIPLEHEKDLIEKATACAARSDVVVLCLGESDHLIGENYAPTRRCDRDDIGLVGNQVALLEALHATGKPIVLVLLSGRANALGTIPEKCTALLHLMEPGEARGTALARILFGFEEPGGRLPWTIPLATGSLPVHYNQHRFDLLRNYALSPAHHAYPFGFGLTYTHFELSEPVLEKPNVAPGEPVRLSTTVKNTGGRTGTAVVQVYVSDEVSSVMRPAVWLAAWSRQTLAPGEERAVHLEVPAAAFAFIRDDETVVVEPGYFGVGLGLSSADLRWARVLVEA